MIHSKSLGEKIAMARKQMNLSQAGLADQISISAQAVGKWERGESLPDVLTLQRLAHILNVDLNYFSDDAETSEKILRAPMTSQEPMTTRKENIKVPHYDMSELQLKDSDFSGLNQLHEKLNRTNMQGCLFVGSELSGLSLERNFVKNCNFSDSDLHDSRMRHCMLSGNQFRNCSLAGVEFAKSFVEECDFEGADLSGAIFSHGGLGISNLCGTLLLGTAFIEMALQDLVFSGKLENCRFERCTFYGVSFEHVTFRNTFFKNNKRMKRITFKDCLADNLTYAFLKNNFADVSGISLLTSHSSNEKP